MRKYFIQTFGCQMNQADSEKVNMILLQSGFMKAIKWQDADLIIFNTCSVRQKWEDRVFGLVDDIVKANQKAGKQKHVFGITGCMVRKTGINATYLPEDIQRNKAKKIEYIEEKEGIYNHDDKLFPRIPKLDFTLRIEEVKYLNLILSRIYWESIGNDSKFDDYLKSKQLRENNFSASIIVQTGCDNYCTFCIVPFTRGKEISRDREEILSECKQAVKEWAKEITLLWQNVNSYGKQFVDKKLWNEEKSKWNEGVKISPFGDLLKDISSIEWLDRIRFTSSNPHDMTGDILDSHFDLDKTCNYLHFALQSGSNDMLKRMNRKHSYDKFKEQVEYLRSKDPLFSISTDIIVWYSWETEEMFQETINAFKELDFDFVYIARYSVRPGTIASKIYPDDVPDSVKAERWHILNSMLLESIGKRNKMMIGREEDILITGERDNQFFWRTRNFKEVFFEKTSDETVVGDVVKVKIQEIDKWVLRGERV